MNDKQNTEVIIRRGPDALFPCCEGCSNLEMVDTRWNGTDGKHAYVFGHCKYWLNCCAVSAWCEEADGEEEENERTNS